MTRLSLKRILFIVFLVFTIMITDSCNTGEKDVPHPVTPTQGDKITNERNEPDETTTVLEATPVNTTIYNKDQDLWGWHTGEYIILKWDPRDYTYFMVYRKTGNERAWKPAVNKKIPKNEFFDNKIVGYKILRYKVVAVDKNNKILYTYDQLMFKLGD